MLVSSSSSPGAFLAWPFTGSALLSYRKHGAKWAKWKMFKDHEADWLENDVLLFHVVPTFRFPNSWQCWYFRRRLYSHLTIQNLPTAPIWGPIKYHHKSDVMRVAQQRTGGWKTGSIVQFYPKECKQRWLMIRLFQSQPSSLPRQSLIVLKCWNIGNATVMCFPLKSTVSSSIIYQGIFLLSTLLCWPFLILKTAKFQYLLYLNNMYPIVQQKPLQGYLVGRLFVKTATWTPHRSSGCCGWSLTSIGSTGAQNHLLTIGTHLVD